MISSLSVPPSNRTAQTTPLAGSNRDLLTLPRAAETLSISKRTLERLIASGAFPHPVKIGRSSRVLRDDIVAYLGKICRERDDKIGNS